MAETVHPTPEDGSLDPGEGIEGESIQQGTPVTPEPGNSGTGLGEDANGNPTEPYPGAAVRPTSWSEVDPAYQELLTDAEAEAQEDTDDDLIDDPAPDLDPEEAAKLQGPVWSTYELWGRNVDESGQWRLVATEKFDGELEAEVGDLDTDSTHEYKVRLVDADGRRSKFSEVIQVSTPSDLTPPPAPTDPTLGQLMSSIDLGWDGALTTATPEDFSHTSLYIRQLHPVDDPDGSAGDSRRVTRFSEAGTWSTSSLPEALHEAWLTAVDTTGNESAASATVEFTPAPPVDEKAIRDDLAAAEERLSDAVAASDAWSASAMTRTDELAADTAEAMNRAGQVGGRYGGEAAPSGTAPENSIWFQWDDEDDPNRTVVGLWKMVDGSWVEQEISDPAVIPHLDIGVGTVGVLTAVRIDVASLYAHDAFVTNLHSEVVNALRLTGEVGFIGGVLLEDETVTAPKIVASDELTAKIAQFLRVKAVHIDANDIVFNSGIVGELEAHGITLSAEVTNRRFEISGEGWVLTDTSTGEVLASVGVDGTILMKNATVQGRFETSYSGGSGITIDYGSLRYYSLKNQAWRTTTAPYIRIADGSGSVDDQPAITVHNSELTVAPGRDSDGGSRYINLDGRTLIGSGRANADFGAGYFYSSDYPFNMNLNAAQLVFTSEDNSRRFGIGRSGYRLKIYGEMPTGQGQDDTFVHGRTGFMSLDSGYGSSGSITYGSPPRTGRRQPYVTSLVSSGSRDAFRAVVTSASAAGTSGFDWVARAPGSNPGTVSFRIMYHAIWGST